MDYELVEELENARGKIVLTSAAFDPKEFCQNRDGFDGLYFWSNFRTRIIPKAKPVRVGTEFSVDYFTLTKDANDAEIEADLPEKHIFSESEVCAVIGSMLEKQPKGEQGDLLTNGYWNLFYTSVFVVFVGWNSGGGGWRVDAWSRDNKAWSAGHRIFSITVRV